MCVDVGRTVPGGLPSAGCLATFGLRSRTGSTTSLRGGTARTSLLRCCRSALLPGAARSGRRTMRLVPARVLPDVEPLPPRRRDTGREHLHGHAATELDVRDVDQLALRPLRSPLR